MHRDQDRELAPQPIRIGPQIGAPCHSDDLRAVEENQVHRQPRDSGRESDNQQPSALGDGAQRGLGVVATDNVEDCVGPAGSARLAELCNQCFRLRGIQRTCGINDDRIRPATGRNDRLVRRRHGSHDSRPHRLGNLHGGEADATRSAEYQRRFARLHACAVLECVARRPVGRDQRGRDVERHRIGNARASHHGHIDLLRHAAPANLCQHAIARREVDHSLTDHLHRPSDVKPRAERTWRPFLVTVRDHQDIRIVHRAGAHRDANVAIRHGRRKLDLLLHQAFGAARAMTHYRAQG